MSDVSDRLAQVARRIRRAELAAGRPEGSVRLLAVSKQQPSAAIAEAARAGQTAFGENYLQEALGKRRLLRDLPLEWHFVGPLQSNKTKAAAENFDWIHTIDRVRIARRLAEQRPAELAPVQVCIQVNVSGEASKSGVAPEALTELAGAVAELPGLRLRGLMALPAAAEGFEQQRVPFRRLAELLEGLRREGLALDTLSMGMSGDLEAAIAEGATIVRLGTAVFGARPSAGSAAAEAPATTADDSP